MGSSVGSWLGSALGSVLAGGALGVTAGEFASGDGGTTTRGLLPVRPVGLVFCAGVPDFGAVGVGLVSAGA